MDYVAYFLLAKVAIFQGFVYSDVINLSLPKYAIDGEDIWVKCSSDIVPYEQIAEFLVNGVTTDTIRRYNNDCFSSITRTVCSTDVCNCSSDGKSYSTNLFANNQIGNVTITCSMKLKRNGEVFKTAHVYISLLESTTHKEYITSSFLKDMHNQLSTKPLATGGTTGDKISRAYGDFTTAILKTDERPVTIEVKTEGDEISRAYGDFTTAILKTDERPVTISKNEGFLYGFLAVSLILGLCF